MRLINVRVSVALERKVMGTVLPQLCWVLVTYTRCDVLLATAIFFMEQFIFPCRVTPEEIVKVFGVKDTGEIFFLSLLLSIDVFFLPVSIGPVTQFDSECRTPSCLS